MQDANDVIGVVDVENAIDLIDLGDAVVETKQMFFIPLFIDSSFEMGLPL